MSVVYTDNGETFNTDLEGIIKLNKQFGSENAQELVESIADSIIHDDIIS
jgi:hypothetical protein